VSAEKFYRHLYGGGAGLLALFSGVRAPGGKLDEDSLRTRYFAYPADIGASLAYAAEESRVGRDVWHCAHLLTKGRRIKENAAPVLSLWGDLDGAEVPNGSLKPTTVVESSPGRFHCYWRLSDEIPPELAEGLNKRLAGVVGADPSGFDLSQLLRVPGTINHKYPDAPVVRILELDGGRSYSPRELDEALPKIEMKRERRSSNFSDEPPVVLDAQALRVWRGEEPKLKEDGAVDRSASLVKIGRVLYDAGANRSVIEAALEERDHSLGWNTYTTRPDAAERYAGIVNELEEKGRGGKESRVQAWPRLDPAALYGLAGDVVRAIEPHCEADPVAILANTLVAVGSVAGRGAFAKVGGDEHHLKLFVGLVGETAKGRKGMSWGPVRSLLEAVDPGWAGERVMGGLSSGEGLIHAVRDEVQGMRKGEEVVLDPGEPDKRLLVLEGELASILKVMGREGNTLSPVMRQAWDGDRLRTMTKNSPTKSTGAHVSIIGHVTKAELLRHLGETERANGFANRFLWLMVRRSKKLPFGGKWQAPDVLIRRLDAAVRFARTPRIITWGASARSQWAEVYGPLSEGKPGLFGAVVGRAEAQALRLAALYAAMEESGTIERTHLEAALAL
jgi:RepB DNA-primase from phage plasmid/Protein of unknown function (DUF3987)